MLDKFFVIKHIQNKNVYYCQYLLTSLHKHKIVTNFMIKSYDKERQHVQ